MAKKITAPKATKTRTSKLAAVTATFNELKSAVREYFMARANQRPDDFKFDLATTTAEGKEHLFKVSSLLAAVLTAQGLGKEVRLIAFPNEKGGSLSVRFFSPVPKPEAIDRIIYS